MTSTRNFVWMVALAGTLAACSSTPMSTPASTAAPAPAPSATGKDATAPAATQAVPRSAVATVTVPPYLDASNPLSTKRSVYFDYDVFSIRPEFMSIIERHGKYLASHPSLAIRIEGHADERGSAEYNLALGQKRAQSVQAALRVYGVKDTQAEAVSWGEERPKAAEHDEAAWALNRRADLQYPKQ